MILGTGAGAGIAVGGRAHHGPNNSAGEWGHNPLPIPDVTEIPGPPCYCGKHGCLETWVSGRGLRQRLPPPRRRATSPSRSTSRRSRSRARATGERLARLVWDRYVDRVARGLALVVNTLDPDMLVMGGGMSNVDELYADLPAATRGLHLLARASTPRSARRRTATPAACAARPGSGRTI